MKKEVKHIAPPRLAEKLLCWFIKGELAEEVLGDLDEKFHSTCEKKGVKRAKKNYWYQVFNYIRPFALKSNSKKRFNNTAMFKHNLLISYRSFKRFKSTFFINLIGLASGLACTLLIYLWVVDELKMDGFHEKGGQIYQVLQHNRWGNEIETDEFTPRMLSSVFLEEFPEVEKAVSVNEDWAESPGIVSFGETKLKAQDNQIDNDFFNIFSYTLLQGDVNQPLPNSKSVLISDELAIKLFSSTEVVGQTINWQQEEMSGDYVISGLFEAPSKASSQQFELLFSMELLTERHNNYAHWGSNNERTYLLMKEGVDIDAFNAKIEESLKTKNDWAKNTLSVQQFGKRYLYEPYVNAKQSGGKITYVRLFSMIALFVLGIACINFMNLTTAKASNRMKEIGVKKAIGARKKSLAYQYFSEALLLAFISLFVAIVIAAAVLPQFNLITGKQLSLSFDPTLIIGALVITIITGLLSGSYPALYLSSLHPIAMLKGKLQQTFGDTWLRKGLVIFQFAISAILITAVMIVSDQIDFIQNKNLGYNKENLLRFDYVTEEGPGYQAFLENLRSIPGVVNAVGAVDDATGVHGGTTDVSWPTKDPENRIEFDIMEVGSGFLETMKIELSAGRDYDIARDEPGRSRMIFNEAAIKEMGLENPIGAIVEVQNVKSEIIGVVKDFHFETMYNNIQPLFIKLTDELEYTLLRINATNTVKTMAAIQKVYEAELDGVPFEPTFVDSNYQAMYTAELSISRLSKYFAGIAIIISCLGLLGLSAFTAEKRSKEIGIRKVLGAGNWRIIYLLSTGFTKMILSALIIGLPLSYLLAQQWIQNFAFGIDLKAMNFIVVGLVTIGIAWLTVSIQTLKAANANPVDSLRSE